MSAQVNRRGLIGASAAMLLLVPAAAGAEKARELDGPLLAACARFHATFAAMTNRKKMTDDECAEVCAAWDDAFDEVAALRPHTPEGLQARAAVAFIALRWNVGGLTNRMWREQSNCYERLAIDCLGDVAGKV